MTANKSSSAQNIDPVLPPVSPNFRFDWGYALRISRFGQLVTVANIVFSGGVLSQALPWPAGNPSLLAFWLAAVTFIIGNVILWVRAPIFLKDYGSYKDFEDRGHSHRFIVWEFYHGIPWPKRKMAAVKETIEKGISFPVDSVPVDGGYTLCPRLGKPTNAELQVQPLVNLRRDIYMPFVSDGRWHVLAMEETDPKLAQKQKELFWIMYVRLASSRPVSRFMVWAFFAGTLVLAFVSAVLFFWRLLHGMPEYHAFLYV